MTSPSPRIWLVLYLILAVLGSFSGPARAQSSQAYYHYKGSRVTLNVDEQSVAVRMKSSFTKGDPATHLRSFNVNAAGSRPALLPRWNFVDMQSPMQGADKVNEQVGKILASSSVEFVSPVFRSQENAPILLSEDILIKLKPEYAGDAAGLLNKIAPELSLLDPHLGNMSGSFRFRSSSRNGFEVLALANRLVEEGYAEWAEPDMIVTGSHEMIPNDSLFPKLWGIHNTGQFGGKAGFDMQGDLAWNITTGDSSVKVMVIDCGVQQNHPDIHQVAGIDFTSQGGGGGGPVNSCDNHGTAVAGCVAATINNSIGIAGIAPSCYVISARTLIANASCDNTFTSQISWTINALAYAGSHGIRITNFSNQFFTTPSSALEAEYQYTHDSLGMVHFAAAGNGSTSVYYPASIPVVNAVGAVNAKGTIATFSNHGPALDFVAPGDSIWVTDRTGNSGFGSGDYYLYRGTSFASPYTAGVAALILSRFPAFTASQVEAKLRSSSVDMGAVGYDSIYGWGFVNAYNAVRSSCIISPISNITVPADPGQCGAIVNLPVPTSSGNCGPITYSTPSGSLFPVGTTVVTCSDTTGNSTTFTVTVTGGNSVPGALRDNFNRADGPLPGSNKWAQILNQPSNGSMSIVGTAIQPTNSSGNFNFGGVVWDSLMASGSEASFTLAQKSGNTNYSSFFVYARMNNKDYLTGTGYRLRYMQQSSADLIELDRVGPGYANTTYLTSTNYKLNPGDVITLKIACDNKTMLVLVNGTQVLSFTDQTYTPAQWYFAVRACVFTTPVRLDDFKVSSSGTTPPPATPVLATPVTGSPNQPLTLTLTWNPSTGATLYRVQTAKDSLFTQLVLDDSTVAGTSRSVGPLSGNTTYYWRVNASNAGGPSAYSAPWNFTTLLTIPPVPVLLTPAKGTLNLPMPVTLTWNSSATATSYRVQIATDSLFSSLVLDDSTVATTSRLASGVANGVKYYWRVNAKNAAGPSVFSTVWNFTTIPLPPVTPVLTAPATGATGLASTLTLFWSSSAGASTYRCQLATDSLFTSIVVNDSTLVTISRAVGPLTSNTTYYWRVNASNAGGTSAYSLVWNFTTAIVPPAPPVLLSPANNAVRQPVTTPLVWNPSAGAVVYNIQVAADSFFTTVLFGDTSASASKPVPGLLNNTKYFWHVNAQNGGGPSAYSATWCFTTIPLPPATPVLATPSSGAVGQPPTLTLSWNPATGASTYRCQVALDSLFASPVINDSTLAATSRPVGPLSGNTTYYWRVSASNNGGTSAYSTVWNFTTALAPPAPPVLLSPANNAVGQPVTIPLVWNPSAGAAVYNIQVAADSLFAIILFTDTSASVSKTVPGLLNNTKYFWHVSAQNGGGSSAFSPAWRFTTIPLPPATPVLATPLSGAVGQPSTLTLSWNPATGASTYRCQVALDSLFASLVINDSTLATTNRAVGPLTSNTKYFWRVNASNAGGTSVFSQVWNFTTVVAVPPVPVLAAPSTNAVNQALTLLLSWNASTGAAFYNLQVAKDSLFATVVFADSAGATSKTVAGLLYSTKYYWRVNAQNNGGTSLYSAVWNFTTIPPVPGKPSLLSPASLSLCQPATMSCSWGAVSGATGYRFQLATDTTFATIVADDSTLVSTSRLVAGLLGNTSYSWRVSAKNIAGWGLFSSRWSFATFPISTLRDDFNRSDGPLPGSNKWALILNHPSSGSMSIVGGAIQPTSSAGNYNFGGVVWDSVCTAGSEIGFTLKQKGGNFSYTSFFLYAKMNSKDYNTGTGYRLRYFEQSGTDILEIHRVGPGYPNSATIATVAKEVNVNDVVTFRVLCDNKTLVAMVNGVQVLSVVDSTYMPAQWYYAVRACLFPTPVRLGSFTMSPTAVIPAEVVPVANSFAETPVPKEFRLDQNYPNPFNPSTVISFALPKPAYVRIRLYSLIGEEVRSLVDGMEDQGYHSVEVNASSLATGVYFYRMEAVGLAEPAVRFTQVKKMIVMK